MYFVCSLEYAMLQRNVLNEENIERDSKVSWFFYSELLSNRQENNNFPLLSDLLIGGGVGWGNNYLYLIKCNVKHFTYTKVNFFSSKEI